MGCNCGKRSKLIGAAVKAISNNRPVAPIVRGIGRTIATDIRSMTRTVTSSRPANPRFGR